MIYKQNKEKKVKLGFSKEFKFFAASVNVTL